MKKFTYKGGCNSPDEDCCYWNGEFEGERFETWEAAKAAAEDRFSTDNGAFWHEVFETEK